MSQKLHAEHRRLPAAELGVLLQLPLLYYLGAKFGASYTIMPEGLAIIWAPNSVLLAALILVRGRHLPLLALLATAAEVAADFPIIPVGQALVYSAINVAEAWIAYALLRRWHFDQRFATIRDVTRFVVAGPLLGALSAALVGGACYSLLFGIETSYIDFVRIWWFGDGLGLMIFTPLLLGFWRQPRGTLWRPSTLGPYDVIVGLMGLAALGLLIGSRDGMMFGFHVGPVMLLPFIIYMSARTEMRWVACAIAVVALVVVVMITRGNNPFVGPPGYNTVVQAQEFIFVMSLLGLGFSALISQLSAKQREAEAANQHLNALNRDLEARVAERTAELNVLNQQLALLAQTDQLTGALNRRGFIEIIQKQLAQSKRYDRPLALIILDIDHFKQVNDRYGHQAGDQVLQQVARLLGDAIRPSDTLARYGGEEFVILAPETGFESAVALGKRILQMARAALIQSEQRRIGITLSLGITTRHGDEQVDELLRRADEALYMAKAEGRDRLVGVLKNHPPLAVG